MAKKFLDYDGLGYLITKIKALVGAKADSSALTSHTGNKSNPHGVTAAQVGAVPTERKVNGKALSADITLSASDVGAAASSHSHDAASTSTAGFMSATDKSKLDGIATGANKTTVDSALSSTSTNPVQNKVINSALAGKAATSHGNHVPATETADDARFLRNDNTWQSVTPENIGAYSVNGGQVSGTIIVNAETPEIVLRLLYDNRFADIFIGSTGLLNIQNRVDSNNFQSIYLNKETAPLKNALQLERVVNGVAEYYKFHHTGNKPSGTYTGTNSTTTQTIDTGGTGDVILVQLTGSGGGMALVSKAGAICKKNSDSSTYALAADKASFIDGVLTLATTDYALNRAYGYNWQVL